MARILFFNTCPRTLKNTGEDCVFQNVFVSGGGSIAYATIVIWVIAVLFSLGTTVIAITIGLIYSKNKKDKVVESYLMMKRARERQQREKEDV